MSMDDRTFKSLVLEALYMIMWFVAKSQISRDETKLWRDKVCNAGGPYLDFESTSYNERKAR